MPNMLEDRLTRLEELTFFQEERIEKLDAALTAQQTQLDAVERELADARLVLLSLRDKLAQQPEKSLPPHLCRISGVRSTAR